MAESSPRPSAPPRKRRFKHLLMAALGKLARLHGVPTLPDWSARPHRVLFIRQDRIGDMILATGTIKAIARAHPTITVDVLASTLNAAVLKGNPHVGAIITIDKKRPWSYVTAIARMRRARYDAVVDSMIMSPSMTTTLLMLCAGAPHRIGLAGRGSDSLLTVAATPVPRAVHYVDRSAALLAPFGVSVTMPEDEASVAKGSGLWPPELFLNAEELSAGEAQWPRAATAAAHRGSRRRLLVNVSASTSPRYWPENRFIEALQQVRHGYPDVEILVVGLPNDAGRMSRVAAGAGAAVVRTPHYRHMMAIVAASDFVLTADTAVTHVASAFRKSVVVLFTGGGKIGAWWGPYGTHGKIIWNGGPLETLEVTPVVQALQEVLSPQQSLSAYAPASHTRSSKTGP